MIEHASAATLLGCPIDDTWENGILDDSPPSAGRQVAVWTGTEMIVWGGVAIGTIGTLWRNSGARYDPATDVWRPVSNANAPAYRADPTAVWTGSEMIVWGGESSGGAGVLGSGGRYDPTTDTWAPTSLAGAPAPRKSHIAVWTGARMIVWGGDGGSSTPLASGGSYDPSTDTWTPVSATGAPSARFERSAVWSANEMIIWGGGSGPSTVSNLFTGGRYDPQSDTWTATNAGGAPLWRVAVTSRSGAEPT